MTKCLNIDILSIAHTYGIFLIKKKGIILSIAIIKTGSKQYKVSEGQTLEVELLKAKKGSKIDFEDLLAGKKVQAEIIDEKKGPKVSVFKYKNKTRYKKKTGHRQKYTSIKIISIK